ncbi:MAG: CDP-diacylglycerol--glycerol-3-phosphate 3-phosphatidyltransferase [Firmicutes bacterium]|nr:CDP-diacylglycerol--glycerol-3-phosphate 3-phosphatidyltransferase [candidate division NPL-UPA2 bacterium]
MNLANRITLSRIFLLPVFLFFVFEQARYGEFIAAGIFIVAAATDGLDGYVARKQKNVTNLGKLLDPLADKLLVMSALVSLVAMSALPAWIAIVIIGREFAVTGLRSIAAAEGRVIAASKFAKVKTVTQIIAITAVMVNNYPFSLVGFPFKEIALWVAVVFTVASGFDYFRAAGDILGERQPSEGPKP